MVLNKDTILKNIASGQAYNNKTDTNVSGSSKDKLFFWEKTVEWIFVRKYYEPRMFAAPLDDAAEGAGDVLINFSGVKKWAVIEFKSNETKISVERGKFPIYGWSKWVEKTGKGRSFSTATNAFHTLVSYWKDVEKPPHMIVFGEKKEEVLFIQAKKTIRELSEEPSTKKQAEEWATELGSQEKSASIEILGCSYWGEWCNEGTLVAGVPPAAKVDLNNLKERGWELEKFKTYVSALLTAKALDEDHDDGGGWLFSSVMGMTEDGKCISFSLYDFALQFGLIPPPPQNIPPVTPPTTPPSTAPATGVSSGVVVNPSRTLR